MNTFERHHWLEICKRVESIAIQILPHLNRKKIKSEVISNLFETISGEYFNSIGVYTQVASSDREPDLMFPSGPCEIKVTGIDDIHTKKCKWMGGKYSKRSSDSIFVMWNLCCDEMFFSVNYCYAHEDDWDIIDKGKNNYYATVFKSEKLLNREHKHLVGEYLDKKFLLEKIPKISNP